MERVKTAVEKIVNNLIGAKDAMIASTALMCLEKGHDKKNTASKYSKISTNFQIKQF